MNKSVVEHSQNRAVVDAHTAAEFRAQVTRIQEVMKEIMQKDQHFGVIPGTQKPTLYKAGSEVLLSTFRIAVDPEVVDLSTPDEIRYRIIARGVHMGTGVTVGAGVGEASSNEEKYKWRDAVCNEEFDYTEEHRRRVKFQKDWNAQPDGYRRRYQVRAEPADIANTILKMAKKRAQIDLTLTALAASDIFTQDLEDMPEGMQHMGEETVPPRGKPETAAPQAKSNGGTDKPATNKQIGLVKARLADCGSNEEELCKHLGISSVDNMPFSKVNDALAFIQKAAK